MPSAKTLAAIAFTLLFLVLGCLWIERPGIYYDEAFFVWATYPDPRPADPGYFEIAGRPMRLMILPYLGALKGWLYRVIVQVFPPTVAVLRIPMLLLGAFTVFLTYRLTARIADGKVALAGAALLATDPAYLLSTRLDWGPAAIQHFFLIAGCYLLVAWWADSCRVRWGAAFFLFGLGVFDKLTFFWMLAALALMTALLVGRATLARLSPALVALAAGCFLAGAAPAIIYRLIPGSVPLPLALDLDTASWNGKVTALWGMFNGTSIPNAIVGSNHLAEGGAPAALKSLIGWLGGPSEPTWFLPALLFSVALLPLIWHSPYRKPAFFAAGFCIAAWTPMFLLQSAGSAHHLILVDPFPQILVAAAIFCAADFLGKHSEPRAATALAVVVVFLLCLQGARLTLGFYTRLLENGEQKMWSSAVYELHERLRRLEPEQTFALDWGLATQVRYLSKARTPIEEVWSYTSAQVVRDGVAYHADNPRILYVRYAPEAEMVVPSAAELWERVASEDGYLMETVETVADPSGRPLYRIERFAAAPSGSATSQPPPAGN